MTKYRMKTEKELIDEGRVWDHSNRPPTIMSIPEPILKQCWGSGNEAERTGGVFKIKMSVGYYYLQPEFITEDTDSHVSDSAIYSMGGYKQSYNQDAVTTYGDKGWRTSIDGKWETDNTDIKCTCPIRELMQYGCKCGGAKLELERERNGL